MLDCTPPQVLDYETQTPRYQPTAEDRKWLLIRLSYYLGLFAAFALIVYRPGPNLFLFHSLFSPSPGEFAAIADSRYSPTIAALKAFDRDRGSLPDVTVSLRDEPSLSTRYTPDFKPEYGTIYGTRSVTFYAEAFNAVVRYDFPPGVEGWSIHSPWYTGRLPLPLVPAGPHRRTATDGASDAE